MDEKQRSEMKDQDIQEVKVKHICGHETMEWFDVSSLDFELEVKTEELHICQDCFDEMMQQQIEQQELDNAILN